jgi:hypothetical protein
VDPPRSGPWHLRMTSSTVLAVAAIALGQVAVVGLIVDGPRAGVFPAVTAVLCGLSIHLQESLPGDVEALDRAAHRPHRSGHCGGGRAHRRRLHVDQGKPDVLDASRHLRRHCVCHRRSQAEG